MSDKDLENALKRFASRTPTPEPSPDANPAQEDQYSTTLPSRKRKARRTSLSRSLRTSIDSIGDSLSSIKDASAHALYASANPAGKAGGAAILYAYYSVVHPHFMQFAQDYYSQAGHMAQLGTTDFMHGVFYGTLADIAIYSASLLSFKAVRGEFSHHFMWEDKIKPGLMGFGGALCGTAAGVLFASNGMPEALVPCTYLGTAIGAGIGISETLR